jgi:hypothetical protein
MSAQGAFKITEEFERLLCEYTGAPYAVAVDNCSNALFLALVREGVRGKEVAIPRHTYPSVPCAIIHAGGRVRWSDCGQHDGRLTGPYKLVGTDIQDCALRFTAGMYQPGRTQCLSFTGPHKHLKLGKGGAILTDSAEDAAWYKRARFSGRHECSYLVDEFDMLGWNFYMLPEIAARGVALMAGFLRDGDPVSNPDLSFKFPDLSRFPIYTRPHDAVFARSPDPVHVGAQTATVTREESAPVRCTIAPEAEPCVGYFDYRGQP